MEAPSQTAANTVAQFVINQNPVLLIRTHVVENWGWPEVQFVKVTADASSQANAHLQVGSPVQGLKGATRLNRHSNYMSHPLADT